MPYSCNPADAFCTLCNHSDMVICGYWIFVLELVLVALRNCARFRVHRLLSVSDFKIIAKKEKKEIENKRKKNTKRRKNRKNMGN